MSSFPSTAWRAFTQKSITDTAVKLYLSYALGKAAYSTMVKD